MSNIGNKHICEQCASRFYDLCADKIICPQCGVVKNETNKKKIEELTVDNIDLFNEDYEEDEEDEEDEDLEDYDEEEDMSDIPSSNSITQIEYEKE